MVEFLLARGADFKSTDITQARKDKSGPTALHNAAVGGYETMAKLLLANGDDVYEFTALHYAARFGHKDIAPLQRRIPHLLSANKSKFTL